LRPSSCARTPDTGSPPGTARSCPEGLQRGLRPAHRIIVKNSACARAREHISGELGPDPMRTSPPARSGHPGADATPQALGRSAAERANVWHLGAELVGEGDARQEGDVRRQVVRLAERIVVARHHRLPHLRRPLSPLLRGPAGTRRAHAFSLPLPLAHHSTATMRLCDRVRGHVRGPCIAQNQTRPGKLEGRGRRAALESTRTGAGPV